MTKDTSVPGLSGNTDGILFYKKTTMKKRIAIVETMTSMSQKLYILATFFGVGAIAIAYTIPRRKRPRFQKGERY